MDQLKELKSAAYDALAQVQHWQRVLESINKQIAEYVPEPSNSIPVEVINTPASNGKLKK